MFDLDQGEGDRQKGQEARRKQKERFGNGRIEGKRERERVAGVANPREWWDTERKFQASKPGTAEVTCSKKLFEIKARSNNLPQKTWKRAR